MGAYLAVEPRVCEGAALSAVAARTAMQLFGTTKYTKEPFGVIPCTETVK
jgi:hypothetical protein